MRLFTSPFSPYARQVIVFADEIGIKSRLDLVNVNPWEDQNLSKLNPQSQVPTLELDGGSSLFDSFVICDYLDFLHDGERLIPEAHPARAAVLRTHSIAQGVMDRAILIRQQVMRDEKTGATPLSQDWWIERHYASMTTCIQRLNDEVGALGSVNISSIAAGVMLGYLDFRFTDFNWREHAPELSGWYKEFAKRPSMKATAPENQ